MLILEEKYMTLHINKKRRLPVGGPEKMMLEENLNA
jgi:hypothetical protein